MPLDEAIIHRARGLLARYQQESKVDKLDPDGLGLIRWLSAMTKREGHSETTSKCYRRWIAAYLEDIGHPASSVVRSWSPPNSRELQLLEDEREARSASRRIEVTATDTNGRYAAYLNQSGMKALLNSLMDLTPAGAPRYKGGDAIALMLVCSAMTGLRPMEWPRCRLLDSYYDPETALTLGPVLEVHTLKQSGRREDNPLKSKRHLWLKDWPDEQIAQLRFAVDNIAHREDYERWYTNARVTLSRAWKRTQRQYGLTQGDLVTEMVKPTGSEASDSSELSVTFYTARHIFAEEVRRSLEFTRFELAALMGHSMLTNQVYYGPREIGADRCFEFALPAPWPGDAEAIMEWDKKVNPMSQSLLQGDMFDDPTWHEAMDASEEDDISRFFIR